MRQFILIFALLVLPLGAVAQNLNCYSGNLQLNRQITRDFSQPFHWESYLPSRSSSGNFMTAARIQLDTAESDSDWDSTLRLDFVSPGYVSLPYNFYGISVSVPGANANYTYFVDFTENCTQSGISLFPSNEYYYQLPSFKLPRLPAGDGVHALRIKVWGSL